MNRTRVKICCIASVAEAELAVAAGADALGLVSTMPSGPGPIGEELIREIAANVPPGVATFLLTSLVDVDAIVAQHARCRTTALQLVDALPAGSLRMLRDALPGVKLVQVIHVLGDASADEALAASEAHAILLDSGNPTLPIKQLGGTGRAHDWTISRKIVDAVPQPLFLAGGLSAANVAEAIDRVRPFGVDICSGVRTNGVLDADKLAAFMTAVEGARC